MYAEHYKIIIFFTAILTFSPISVFSPPERICRSGSNAQLWMTLSYQSLSKCLPKRTLSLNVAFGIQVCWGTYAIEPYKQDQKMQQNKHQYDYFTQWNLPGAENSWVGSDSISCKQHTASMVIGLLPPSKLHY